MRVLQQKLVMSGATRFALVECQQGCCVITTQAQFDLGGQRVSSSWAQLDPVRFSPIGFKNGLVRFGPKSPPPHPRKGRIFANPCLLLFVLCCCCLVPFVLLLVRHGWCFSCCCCCFLFLFALFYFFCCLSCFCCRFWVADR